MSLTMNQGFKKLVYSDMSPSQSKVTKRGLHMAIALGNTVINFILDDVAIFIHLLCLISFLNLPLLLFGDIIHNLLKLMLNSVLFLFIVVKT